MARLALKCRIPGSKHGRPTEWAHELDPLRISESPNAFIFEFEFEFEVEVEVGEQDVGGGGTEHHGRIAPIYVLINTKLC